MTRAERGHFVRLTAEVDRRRLGRVEWENLGGYWRCRLIDSLAFGDGWNGLEALDMALRFYRTRAR